MTASESEQGQNRLMQHFMEVGFASLALTIEAATAKPTPPLPAIEPPSNVQTMVPDLATRVYNHTFRIDPVVRTLLDTDFYKLLMLQMIWKLHRHRRVLHLQRRRVAGKIRRLAFLFRADRQPGPQRVREAQWRDLPRHQRTRPRRNGVHARH